MTFELKRGGLFDSAVSWPEAKGRGPPFDKLRVIRSLLLNALLTMAEGP